MKILNKIYIDNDHKYKIFTKDFFMSITNGMINLLNYKYSVEVNLIICNEEKIQELNKKYRNIDKPTDVLSFPLNSDINIIKACGLNLLGDI